MVEQKVDGVQPALFHPDLHPMPLSHERSTPFSYFKTVDENLQEYRKRRDASPPRGSKLLTFTHETPGYLRQHFGILDESKGVDIYNGTSPFTIGGIEFIAARVEKPDDEFSSKILFFTQIDESYHPVEGVSYNLQDPFITTIQDEIVFGGVEANRNGYKTIFYRGKDIHSLEKFAEGPERMKDIRLVQKERIGSEAPAIGVYTRPQGGEADKGQIGYTEIASLDDLTTEAMKKAKLLNHRFVPGEWGGVNHVLNLGSSKMLVLAHIAKFDREGNRHYYPWAFLHERIDGKDDIQEIGILAERTDLPFYPPKRNDLYNVLFTGGAKISGDELIITVGIGDAALGVITQRIPETLKKYLPAA